METQLAKNEVILAAQSLLAGVFCVDKDIAEDEALDKIVAILRNGRTLLEMPVRDKELVRDRLFGGFRCGGDENRRHIYFALGHYTFLNRENNRPMGEAERAEVWHELRHENPDTFLGDGPFCEIELETEKGGVGNESH